MPARTTQRTTQTEEIGSPDYFWHRVKQLLKAHKISQRKFADYIDVSVDTFWAWIRYDRIPGAFTACKIAEALGVTVEYLVRGTDSVNIKERTRRLSEQKSAAERLRKLVPQIEEQISRL